MTTTLALAARLRALPDDKLTSLLRARPVRRAGVSDFFDLAEALLDPESVQRALAPSTGRGWPPSRCSARWTAP
ncbi:hypothetical protein [Leifsonia sp. P73]|uniref:hypothetical protein n=1 Tax=Leifsonia sp. P73 TaxID=3423959 RepID=UPI003DA32F4E